jgi:hypothetical protein
LFGGLGAAFDRKETTASPELGVRFFRGFDEVYHGSQSIIAVSWHILVRADVGRDLGVRGATILFGWHAL